MGISRSAYYGAPAMALDDTAIVEAMSAIRDEFEHYGWRRVQAALRQQGLVVNHKKVKRLMREHDLQPRMRRRHVAPTDSERPSDLPKSGTGQSHQRRQSALGRRHHLRRSRVGLRLRRGDARRLVAPRRRLRHQPIHRCPADARGSERRNRGPQTAGRLPSSLDSQRITASFRAT